jgi:ankyrin repeat protein
MEIRPGMAREENKNVKKLLELDPSLGYVENSNGNPLLVSAANRGHVGVARELLRHCPDAPYCNKASGWTCLHQAAFFGHDDFLEFVPAASAV